MYFEKNIDFTRNERRIPRTGRSFFFLSCFSHPVSISHLFEETFGTPEKSANMYLVLGPEKDIYAGLIVIFTAIMDSCGWKFLGCSTCQFFLPLFDLDINIGNCRCGNKQVCSVGLETADFFPQIYSRACALPPATVT